MSNIEYRAVNKFFTWKGMSATEITKELTDVYGHSAPSYSTVAKWIVEFNDPTRAFEAVPRSGRTLITLTDESVRAVEGILMRDR